MTLAEIEERLRDAVLLAQDPYTGHVVVDGFKHSARFLIEKLIRDLERERVCSANNERAVR